MTTVATALIPAIPSPPASHLMSLANISLVSTVFHLNIMIFLI